MSTYLADITLRLLKDYGMVRTAQLAEEAGVSRQAAHKYIAKSVAEGELIAKDSARARYYVASRGQVERQYSVASLEEDQAWLELEQSLPSLAKSSEEFLSIAQYAFTELLNNAIDHSRSPSVNVNAKIESNILVFEIRDQGCGAFFNIQSTLKLKTLLEAIQELSKGKVTTMPTQHTGEGVFFSSKAVNFFQIESNGLSWIVDNRIRDMAVQSSNIETGTRVFCEIDRDTNHNLLDIFAKYTDNFEFSKTITTIKLFEIGTRFVSRSEGKRLTHGLEKFSEIILDFQGVRGIGQGFADQVFRVWKNQYPNVVLTPINMNEPVRFMLNRVHS